MVRDYLAREYSRPQWTEGRFQSSSHNADTHSRYHGTGGVGGVGVGVGMGVGGGVGGASLSTIGEALRERCNIPADKYFVATILDDGEVMYYGGPDDWHRKEMHTFFNPKAFELAARRHFSGAAGDDLEYGIDDYGRHANMSDYGTGRRGYTRRQGTSVFDPFEHEGHYKARKRPRALRRGDDGEEDAPATIRMVYKEIRVDDAKQIWEFCDTRFKNLQQTACKLVAKAWVKLVEPKKQSTHPYTGSDEKAPDWWPKPWGTTRDEKVRHKEPDHLYKKERVYLLNHILRMIVEPNSKQHPDIQKLRLNVDKLEEATFEALSSFFLDKDNPGNAKKKPYLKEIFKVAKAQESFKNGEKDGDYKIYVMADDKFPDDWQSGDDASGSQGKPDDEHQQQQHARQGIDRASTSSHMPSPPKATNPHGGLLPTPGSEQSPTGAGVGVSVFLNEIPVRPQQFQPSQILTSDLGGPAEPHHHPAFVDAATIHAQPSGQSLHDMYGGGGQQQQQGANRRAASAMYPSPTEYGSASSAGPGAPGQGMYPAWQQPQQQQHHQQQQQQQQPQQQQHGGPPAPTSAPSNASMYTFTTTQHQHQQQQQPGQQQQHAAPPPQQQQGPPTHAPPPFVTQAGGGMPMPPHAPQYMGGPIFDGLPRVMETPYDAAAHQGMFRPMTHLSSGGGGGAAPGMSSGNIGVGGVGGGGGGAAGGYPAYLTHDGRSLSGQGGKVEGMGRGPLH